MIKEIIVVEGKDDIAAVKSAVDAEIIATGGFGFSEELIDRISKLSEKRGVIILTDPDFAGEKIRKTISKGLKKCKHAFIPREKATKEGNIGVENASKEAIIEALNKARVETVEKRIEFTQADMIECGLIGNEGAADRRDELGRILGIGYCNSKQFLKRLNNYGITREEFSEAIRRLEGKNE